ncbi:methylmalonyl-CoA epimerase [candidate division KSB1 bacterium]|nr:methylmalonyl-CoA epimerase [candidate division KSB1 bacterium]
MIHGIDHLAIAVASLDDAVAYWTTHLGAVEVHRETVSEQRVNVVMLRVGDLKIELLQPTSDDSPVAKFIAVRGPGIHHVALRVDSTDSELSIMKAGGATLLDEGARDGAEGTKVGFIHPRTLGGVLVELVEHSRHES